MEMSGQEIYDNFQQGKGAEGISSSAAMVKELTQRHKERVGRLAALRTRMESAWQGDAAEAANRGLGPATTEHGESGLALHRAQDLTDRQAGSFGDAKHNVVPVPPAPDAVDPLVILTNPDALVTAMDQQTAHNEAAQRNVDVMDGYTGASTFNTDHQPKSFGAIVDDQAGITVGEPSGGAIDSDDYRESTSDSGQQDSVPGPGSDGTPGYGPPAGDAGTPSGASRGDAGTTTPGGYTATLLPAGVTSLPSGTDSALGQPRPMSDGRGFSGLGVGLPFDSRGFGSGEPRGGALGGPRGGVPRGGGLLTGTPGGSVPGAVPTAGPGRGGVGFGGVPMGAGRGRGDEDTERKTPAYLEGGDPEELFDTDQLTAPAAIGEDDD